MRPLLAVSLLGLASLAAVAACSSDNNNGGTTRDVTIVSGNNDGTTHRVVSDAPLFDSGNMANGATYTFNFTAPGTYTYHCSIHPGMVGSIVIDP